MINPHEGEIMQPSSSSNVAGVKTEEIMKVEQYKSLDKLRKILIEHDLVKEILSLMLKSDGFVSTSSIHDLSDADIESVKTLEALETAEIFDVFQKGDE